MQIKDNNNNDSGTKIYIKPNDKNKNKTHAKLLTFDLHRKNEFISLQAY